MDFKQITKCLLAVYLLLPGIPKVNAKQDQRHQVPASTLPGGGMASIKVTANQPFKGYKINNKIAPQVQSDPVINELRKQLRDYKFESTNKVVNKTLPEVLESALLNNPILAESYAEIQGAEWNLIAVRRQWYPTLNVTKARLAQSYRINTRERRARPSRASNSLNQISELRASKSDAEINITWTFFDPSRSSNINSRSERLRSLQLLFDVKSRDLVLSVQQTYLRLQEYLELINSYENILTSTERLALLTEAQFNSGLVSIADVEQIRVQQYQTLTTLIDTYRQLLNDSARLSELMTMSTGTLVMPSIPLYKYGAWSDPLPVTISQALRLREEVQSSLAEASSASWAANSLINSYLPKLALGGLGSYDNLTTRTSGLPNPANNTNYFFDGALGLNFTWQLFDGGINAANAKVNDFLALGFEKKAANQRLIIVREVEQSYNNYIMSQLSLDSANAQLLASKRAMIAVEARFIAGVGDMTSVIQSLRQAVTSATVYSNSIFTYNNAIDSLYRSSARWPDGALSPFERRKDMLRNQSLLGDSAVQ